MLFSRETYKAAGGHKPLKNSLVADVYLAREVKRKGNKAVIANIAPSVTCTVYETNKETWEGFLKNSFNGIGRSKAAAGLLVLFYTVFYIVPFFLLFILASAAAFLLLLLTAMKKKSHTWKGRAYEN